MAVGKINKASPEIVQVCCVELERECGRCQSGNVLVIFLSDQEGKKTEDVIFCPVRIRKVL